MSNQAYPLQWPVGRKRWEGQREYSKFKMSESAMVGHLYDELDRLGATDVVVSTNRSPYSRAQNIEDPGVAVYFFYKGKQVCIAADRYVKVQDNLHAVGLCVEAIRGMERWGTGDMVDASFTGFAALPEAAGASRSWWAVLGLDNATKDKAMITDAFKHARAKAHPDAGGSDAAFIEVQRAYEEGMRLAE